jgi:predicted lipoprotein with Yx(FWY)xxD motif
MFDRKSQTSMQSRKSQTSVQSRRRGRLSRGRPSRSVPSVLVICTTVVTVALIASFAAIALAASSAEPTVGSASNAKFNEKIVVDGHGRTLYVLSPETAHHLLCKSGECLKLWPPLTVRSRKGKLTTGSGVHSHLGILRRSNGTFQVTLGGLPLYRFSGDSAKGAANGEGIKSFGGTWHAISAATGAAPAPASAETTPAPTTSTPATTSTPTTATPTPTTTTPPPTTTPPAEKYGY